MLGPIKLPAVQDNINVQQDEEFHQSKFSFVFLLCRHFSWKPNNFVSLLKIISLLAYQSVIWNSWVCFHIPDIFPRIAYLIFTFKVEIMSQSISTDKNIQKQCFLIYYGFYGMASLQLNLHKQKICQFKLLSNSFRNVQ